MGMAEGDGEEHVEEHVEPEQSVYYWPVLNFQAPPARRYHFHKQIRSQSAGNNFFKGVKWYFVIGFENEGQMMRQVTTVVKQDLYAKQMTLVKDDLGWRIIGIHAYWTNNMSPDGSCFLTSSEDNNLRVFDLPSDVLESTDSDISKSDEDSFAAALTIDEGEAVYDFCWYPLMTTADAATCTFATSTRDHPVHLWDAVSGQIRCTYRAYDAMDEITAAYSIAFNNSGTKLFCGYNKTLRVFDTSRPGREFSQYSTLTKTKDGQTGIISCLAFSPSSDGLFAAGSYNKTTALYSEHNAELLFVLHGQEGGVTQLLFSKDGNYLYTGGRKDPNILCWDVRNTAGIVYKLPRITSDTNQRIAFDIEPCGRHLGTGGQDGFVHIYDLQTGDWANSFQAAADTVNGFGFHPTLPLVVTSSGHRRFSSSFDDEVKSKETSCIETNAQENCASVWLFPCTWQSSGDVSVSVEATEFDNFHVESKGAQEVNVQVDVQVEEVSQASITLMEVNETGP